MLLNSAIYYSSLENNVWYPKNHIVYNSLLLRHVYPSSIQGSAQIKSILYCPFVSSGFEVECAVFFWEYCIVYYDITFVSTAKNSSLIL